eukprot:1139782-Pelagomonas_calceolata.AAC.2
MACSSAVEGVNGVPGLKPSVSESLLRQFFSVAWDASPTCQCKLTCFRVKSFTLNRLERNSGVQQYAMLIHVCPSVDPAHLKFHPHSHSSNSILVCQIASSPKGCKPGISECAAHSKGKRRHAALCKLIHINSSNVNPLSFCHVAHPRIAMPPPCNTHYTWCAVVRGCESNVLSIDEDEIPPAELVQRLAQVPVGQQLPAQLMAAVEGKGVWDDCVGEQEEQEGLNGHARQVKDDLHMTDEQLADMMRPRTSCLLPGQSAKPFEEKCPLAPIWQRQRKAPEQCPIPAQFPLRNRQGRCLSPLMQEYPRRSRTSRVCATLPPHCGPLHSCLGSEGL